MKTLEDIEKEVAESWIIRQSMKKVIKNLKNVEKDSGPEIIKDLILGKKVLNPEQFKQCREKFGINGLRAIEAMEDLTKYQKQYLFKQMGYPIEEVT